MTVTKAILRRQVLADRDHLTHRSELSEAVCRQVLTQPSYRAAASVMMYLSCRSEVDTGLLVETAQAAGKQVIIPYCTHDLNGQPCLGLWRLGDKTELVAGTWGILEPPKARWDDRSKTVTAQHLDCIVTPGVAFDRNGGRLGYGAGYYDRLLAKVRYDATVIGICFEAQLVEEVEQTVHDIAMDWVITEAACYQGRGRADHGD